MTCDAIRRRAQTAASSGGGQQLGLLWWIQQPGAVRKVQSEEPRLLGSGSRTERRSTAAPASAFEIHCVVSKTLSRCPLDHRAAKTPQGIAIPGGLDRPPRTDGRARSASLSGIGLGLRAGPSPRSRRAETPHYRPPSRTVPPSPELAERHQGPHTPEASPPQTRLDRAGDTSPRREPALPDARAASLGPRSLSRSSTSRSAKPHRGRQDGAATLQAASPHRARLDRAGATPPRREPQLRSSRTTGRLTVPVAPRPRGDHRAPTPSHRPGPTTFPPPHRPAPAALPLERLPLAASLHRARLDRDEAPSPTRSPRPGRLTSQVLPRPRRGHLTELGARFPGRRDGPTPSPPHRPRSRPSGPPGSRSPRRHSHSEPSSPRRAPERVSVSAPPHLGRFSAPGLPRACREPALPVVSTSSPWEPTTLARSPHRPAAAALPGALSRQRRERTTSLRRARLERGLFRSTSPMRLPRFDPPSSATPGSPHSSRLAARGAPRPARREPALWGIGTFSGRPARRPEPATPPRVRRASREPALADVLRMPSLRLPRRPEPAPPPRVRRSRPRNRVVRPGSPPSEPGPPPRERRAAASSPGRSRLAAPNRHTRSRLTTPRWPRSQPATPPRERGGAPRSLSLGLRARVSGPGQPLWGNGTTTLRAQLTVTGSARSADLGPAHSEPASPLRPRLTRAPPSPPQRPRTASVRGPGRTTLRARLTVTAPPLAAASGPPRSEPASP
ncbi:PREDICTED: serine/arginine repetitive matrix protein 1-like [Chrysochloris asiatica]|uniref:Serine/arginine repetitive matrix protein 1-like n=1 Tax=Chrysochloris asiatica TaxID=185453 RepID=A0A9B0TNE7_CHRAS|nr:PREDICTED: serine/arginine repetitive matrix protein 1-like [Chrysochloris asiatica]